MSRSGGFGLAQVDSVGLEESFYWFARGQIRVGIWHENESRFRIDIEAFKQRACLNRHCPLKLTIVAAAYFRRVNF